MVTGGAGYIGSHTVIELLQAGYEVVVLDNLCNSSRESLRRVEMITGWGLEFVEGDVRDQAQLAQLFRSEQIDAVIHFAGLKAVGESVAIPLTYYANNVSGTITLCQAMADAGVFRLVFSSSATAYGLPMSPPLIEDAKQGIPANPYARTKLMVEEILSDLAKTDERWSIALLRYFNPVGAHVSGLIGEDPLGTPNNLLPYISQVAVGRLSELLVFGDDYPTRDGTGVRDYIHVTDLARGHLKALAKLAEKQGVSLWNLGTGQGYSVLEMIRAFEKVAGKKIPFRVVPRREGDAAEYWSDPAKAERELGWRAERGIEQMVEDTWRWQSNNPSGYKKNI
jgi:UDP-glucose 4-epimerase